MTFPKPQLTASGLERRVFSLTELRLTEADQQPRIAGYSAVFNSLSEDLGGFRERIRPGAFSKTLEESADVRALLNHDPNYVLGRTRSGTLRLVEDERGLAVENQPPDTQWARDLVVSMRRGDVDQMSFQFKTIRDEWLQENNMVVRELVEVRLFDVSVVTFPAYPQTTVGVRALADLGLDWTNLLMSITRVREGQVGPEERSRIESFIQTLQSLLTAAPGQAAHPAASGDPSGPQVRNGLRRRQLDLAERS